MTQRRLRQSESCVQRVESRDGEIGVKKLLQHLRRGHEVAFFSVHSSQERSRLLLERMTSADRIHEDVGVNENQVSVAPERIEASITLR